MAYRIDYNVGMIDERQQYIAYSEDEVHEIIDEIVNVFDGYNISVTNLP